jgi:hypothetical protein
MAAAGSSDGQRKEYCPGQDDAGETDDEDLRGMQAPASVFFFGNGWLHGSFFLRLEYYNTVILPIQ